MKVVLIGSGASRAALGEAAVLCPDFGRALDGQWSGWRAALPFLAAAVDYLREQDGQDNTDGWDLGAVWNGIDENCKLSLIVGNMDPRWPNPIPARRLYEGVVPGWQAFWVFAGVELRRALNSVYGLQLSPRIDRYVHTVGQVGTIIRDLDPDDVVATTNYDLLVESIAHDPERLTAGNCLNADEIRGVGRPIWKLHGSLDWNLRSHHRTGQHVITRVPDRTPLSDEQIDLDGDGWEHRPLVIAPVRYKDELLVSRMQPFEVVTILTLQWRRFLESLEVADEIWVLGFAFRDDDAHIQRILREAMRRRANRPPLRVRSYSANCAQQVRHDIRCAFGRQLDVDHRGRLDG